MGFHRTVSTQAGCSFLFLWKANHKGISCHSLPKKEHDLVLKGYGWMLKALSQVDQHCVEEYVIKNHSRMPRVAYRYALEKFDKETIAKLMGM